MNDLLTEAVNATYAGDYDRVDELASDPTLTAKEKVDIHTEAYAAGHPGALEAALQILEDPSQDIARSDAFAAQRRIQDLHSGPR